MTSEQNKLNIDMKKYLYCLGGLSILQNILLHPLNVVLTKKQNICNDMSFYKYTKQIIHNNNITYLSRGMYTSIGGYSFGQIIHLFGIEYCKINPYFENENNNIIFAGTVSDFFSCVIHYPFSLLSTMQITYKKPYTSYIFTKRLYDKNGIKSLYNGFGLYATSGCAWSGLWWLLYENSKNVVKKHSNNNENDIVINGLCSLNSTIITTLLFNPFSVIVTKMQADRKANYYKIIRNIYIKKGIQGFWSASLLNVGSFICTDLFFSLTYEISRNYAMINH